MSFGEGFVEGLTSVASLKQRKRQQELREQQIREQRDYRNRNMALREDKFEFQQDQYNDQRQNEEERQRALAELNLAASGVNTAPLTGIGTNPDAPVRDTDVNLWQKTGAVPTGREDVDITVDEHLTTADEQLIALESSRDPTANTAIYDGEGNVTDRANGLFQITNSLADNLDLRKPNGQWTIPGFGTMSEREFLSEEGIPAQKAAYRVVKENFENELQRIGAYDRVGERLPDGTPITETGLMYGIHLSGMPNMKKFLEQGRDVSDQFGTEISDYMREGYLVEKSTPRKREQPNVAPVGRAIQMPSQMVGPDEWTSQFYSIGDFKNNGEFGNTENVQMDARLGVVLDDVTMGMRERLGKDFKLNVGSGYRSPEYNKEVYKRYGKKPTKSQHSHGRAVDISLDNLNTKEKRDLVALSVANGATGIGAYPNNNSVHVDVRTKQGKGPGGLALWYGGKAFTKGPDWFKDGVRSGLQMRNRIKRGDPPQIAGARDQGALVGGSNNPRAGRQNVAQRVMNFMQQRGPQGGSQRGPQGGSQRGPQGRSALPTADETLLRRQLTPKGAPLDRGPTSGALPVTEQQTGREPSFARAIPTPQADTDVAIATRVATGGQSASQPALPDEDREPPRQEQKQGGESRSNRSNRRRKRVSEERRKRLVASQGGFIREDDGVGLRERQVGWSGANSAPAMEYKRRVALAARYAPEMIPKITEQYTQQASRKLYAHGRNAIAKLDAGDPEGAITSLKKASIFIPDEPIPIFDTVPGNDNTIVAQFTDPNTGEKLPGMTFNSQSLKAYIQTFTPDRFREMNEWMATQAQNKRDRALEDSQEQRNVNKDVRAEAEAVREAMEPLRDTIAQPGPNGELSPEMQALTKLTGSSDTPEEITTMGASVFNALVVSAQKIKQQNQKMSPDEAVMLARQQFLSDAQKAIAEGSASEYLRNFLDRNPDFVAGAIPDGGTTNRSAASP